MKSFKEFDKQARIDDLIAQAEKCSRNIPRSTMPQITMDNTKEFLDFLSTHKVTYTNKKIHSKHIGFAQGNFHRDKVEHLVNDNSGVKDRKIFVSKDMIVLDGNHRILANQVNDEFVNIVMINLPIMGLITLLRSFTKAEYRE